MPDIVMRSLREEDAAAVLDAHLRNRAYLAPFEPPRSESFFTLDGQRDRMRSIVARERAGELATRAMIRGDRVVGYASFADLTPSPRCGATIGYWVDPGEQGRGLATAAVADLLVIAADRGVHRMEAATAPTNTGSQKVLTKNGFVHYGTAHSHLFLNGAWQDSHLFERILNDDPPGT
ncbi:GNAT family N-acetyltransferase [Actinoplanes subglobosus]|uniref:GNAT family N-acetyltransferase n=1 Tax=Actinoplanes subglobosus TaxID=1547892 RepID=A0ABV8IZD9_9ACTN